MNTRFPLAAAAALIADPARAAMLTALLDARPLSAGELARSADVSPQSASMHLAQLLAGGFLKVSQQGRHRYYSIANSDVAHAVEALGTVSTAHPYRPSIANRDLCFARSCYDHLAGALGVQLTVALQRRGLVVPSGETDYEITRRGEELLAHWRIDTEALRRTRRAFARRCLDWTERRYHLAGALGAALFEKFLQFHWIRREKKSRVVYLSPAGQRELARLFNLELF
jgi:DNA-binding transcriptional ArsR family regulator